MLLELNSECRKSDNRLYFINGRVRTRDAFQSKSSPFGSCLGNSRRNLLWSRDPNSFCAPLSLLLWSLLYFGRCASLSGVAPANTPSGEETSCKAVEWSGRTNYAFIRLPNNTNNVLYQLAEKDVLVHKWRLRSWDNCRMSSSVFRNFCHRIQIDVQTPGSRWRWWPCCRTWDVEQRACLLM